MPSQQHARIFEAERRALLGCSGSQYAVYHALAMHSGSEGICWPSRERIAELTGMDVCNVSRATAALARRGLIEKTGSGCMIRYRLLHHAPSDGVEISTQTVSILTPRTEQGTSLSLCATQKSEPDLAAVATPPPDSIPALWLEEAQQLRPDLPAAAIGSSGKKFLDHHRARGTRLADWRPAWRNWVRRERTHEPAARPRQTAPQAASRYHPAKPDPERMRRALEASEANRQALLLSYGIVEQDPAAQGAALEDRQAAQGAALEDRQAAQGAALVVEALARNLAGAMRIPSPPRAGREIKPAQGAKRTREYFYKEAIEKGYLAPDLAERNSQSFTAVT